MTSKTRAELLPGALFSAIRVATRSSTTICDPSKDWLVVLVGTAPQSLARPWRRLEARNQAPNQRVCKVQLLMLAGVKVHRTPGQLLLVVKSVGKVDFLGLQVLSTSIVLKLASLPGLPSAE